MTRNLELASYPSGASLSTKKAQSRLTFFRPQTTGLTPGIGCSLKGAVPNRCPPPFASSPSPQPVTATVSPPSPALSSQHHDDERLGKQRRTWERPNPARGFVGDESSRHRVRGERLLSNKAAHQALGLSAQSEHSWHASAARILGHGTERSASCSGGQARDV